MEDWAIATKRLGIAYVKRILGFYDDNVEEAIACFESALRFCSRDSRERWGLENNLGIALLRRGIGDEYDNARKAITTLAKR